MPYFRNRNDLEVLSRDQCLELLAASGVGRVGLSMDALPVVLPVNYLLDGDRIVFRTGQGSKLSAALRNAVMCFEVDDLERAVQVDEPAELPGASVLGHGRTLRRGRLAP